jgi:hypothetical protein
MYRNRSGIFNQLKLFLKLIVLLIEKKLFLFNHNEI